MSRSAFKLRDIRSSARKELRSDSMKPSRSASLDSRAARGSYCPEKFRSSSDERKSGNKLFAGWGSTRKSSITILDAKRKDTRPLTDKAYQKRKVYDLCEFLEEMGFPYSISTSKLMSPSKKDFENIFQFLYKYFNPVYEIKRIEEEGPKILKNLGYPFTINKSAFLYVARTHWPNLLGALVWLMDVIKFSIKVDMKGFFEKDVVDEKSQIDVILRRYLLHSYHSGIDNEEEEENVFTKMIKSSSPVSYEEVLAINEEKKRKLQLIDKEIEDLNALAEHNETLDTHIKNYEDYILKMKSHCQKKKELCDQIMEDLKQKESVLKNLEEDLSKKQNLYDDQGFDGKKHVHYFETQRKVLRETLEKKRTVIVALRNKLWETEIEYKNSSDKIIADAESFRSMYNRIADESKILLQPLLNIKIPQVQKLCSTFYFEFPDWNISMHKYDASLRKAYRSALKEIDEKFKVSDELIKRVNDGLKQQLHEIEIKMLELNAQIKLLSIQENQKESDINSKQRQTEGKLSALHTQCEMILKNVEALKTEKSKLEETYNEMSEELITLQNFHERKVKELKEYLSEQKEMFEYFETSEKHLMELVEECGKEVNEQLEDLKF